LHKAQHLRLTQREEVKRQLHHFFKVLGPERRLSLLCKLELAVLDLYSPVNHLLVHRQDNEDVAKVEKRLGRLKQVDDLRRVATIQIVNEEYNLGPVFCDIIRLSLERVMETPQHTLHLATFFDIALFEFLQILERYVTGGH